MRVLIVSISALLGSFALFMTGIGLLNTLIGIRGANEGMSTTTIGIVMSAYYFGLMLGSMYSQKIIRHSGYIRSFAAFVAVVATMALAHAIAVNEIMWFCLRFICGYCVAGQFVVVESWLNERANNKNRATLLSVYIVVTHVAVAIGQFLLFIADPNSFELFAYATMLCVMSMVPLLLTKSIPPNLNEAPKALQFMGLYKASPLAFIAVFIYGMNNAAFYSLSSVFVLKIGLLEVQVPIFITAAIFGGMIFQIPIGKIADKIDRRLMIVILSMIACISCFFIYIYAKHTNPSLANMLPFLVCFGASGFALYAVSVAHANDFSNSEQRTQLSGALLMVFGLGSTLGPIVGSQIMLLFSPAAMYLMMGAAYGFIVLFSLYRMIYRKGISIDERSNLPPMNYSTPSTALMQGLIEDEKSKKH